VLNRSKRGAKKAWLKKRNLSKRERHKILAFANSQSDGGGYNELEILSSLPVRSRRATEIALATAGPSPVMANQH
jgi:hypothetical protein